jgi:hypothetical protein
MRINGKRVVDATRPLHITVTARDAAGGKRNDPGGCAAARAIVRGYRDTGAKQARVHLGRTYVEYDDRWVRYNTPISLKTEITSFDRGTKAAYATGDYNLAPIQPSNRFGARPKPQGATGSRKRRPHIARIRHQIEGVRARGANK